MAGANLDPVERLWRRRAGWQAPMMDYDEAEAVSSPSGRK